MKQFIGAKAKKLFESVLSRGGSSGMLAVVASLCLVADFVAVPQSRTVSVSQTAPATPAVCNPSGINAANRPMKAYDIRPEELTEYYLKAEKAFRAAKAGAGEVVPSYIGAELLARNISKESKDGRIAYTKGNSYMGLAALAPNLPPEKSHFAAYESKILAVLNAEPVRKTLSIPASCGAVTHSMIVDANYFFDPMLQSLAALTIAYEADKRMVGFKNYARMQSSQKIAALYIFYNVQELARISVNHIDSKMTITQLLTKGRHPHRHQLIGFMRGNPQVYPVAVTPSQLFKHYLDTTSVSADLVKQKSAAKPMVVAQLDR